MADLKDANIVTNWPQLRRLIDNYGFPAGYLLSPGCRVFDADKVEAWIESRRAASETAREREVRLSAEIREDFADILTPS